MQKKKGVGAITIIIISVVIGYCIKNIKMGMLFGIILGVLASRIISTNRF
jgi:preprotein translocase subunit SecF